MRSLHQTPSHTRLGLIATAAAALVGGIVRAAPAADALTVRRWRAPARGG